jgi:hypothetical protein
MLPAAAVSPPERVQRRRALPFRIPKSAYRICFVLARLSRAAAAFTAVLVAYLAYATLAVPWIEPTLPRSAGGGDVAGSRRLTHHDQRRRILASLFPEGAWELNDSHVKVLETEYGMLLLLDYRTGAGGQLEIQPCTVVLEIPSKDPARPPRHLALQAPQGAVLQFDRDIDLRRAEIGRPVGGRLQGEVRIFSPPSAPGADDALQIVTQNVQMDAGRVWTPYEVSFRFGRSHGAGRGLTIELLSANSGGSRNVDATSIAGVRRLDLARLEKAHLEAPPEGLFSDRSQPASGAAKKSPVKDLLEAPLEITCQGLFRCDFEELVASFEDEVEVRRLHPNGRPDQLSCQLLEIFFSSPGGSPFGPSEPAAAQSLLKKSEADPVDKSTLRKVVAVGRPLVLRAPSVGAFVKADRMEYDLEARRLRLENQQPLSLSPREGASGAILEHQGRHFEAPRLQYELGPPHRLGRLWAAGPGFFRGPVAQSSRHFPELPEGAIFEFSWRREIHLRPHDGLHVASATGGAAARVGEIGGFEAGELHVWLREIPDDSRPTPAAGDAPRYQILPDRLLAQGSVNFHSPRLSGAAGKLEAWFEDAAPSADPDRSPDLLARGRDDAGLHQQTAYDVRGDLVQLRVLRRGDRAMLEDATLRGHVVLRETQTSKRGEAPLTVAGDLVELRGGSGQAARLRVLGDPQANLLAQAAARGMAFSGWRLHIDQGANRVWIDGPGKLMLPLKKESLTRFAAGPAPARQGPSSISVAWRKGLDFDGRRVLIEEQVETRGDGQVIRSDSLQAFLARPLDLSRTEQLEQTEFARLLFGGRREDGRGVVVENQTHERGALQSMDKAQTRNLELDLLAGRMRADGPGWIESVRQGGFDMPGLPPAGPAAAAKSRGLSFVRVDFQEAITGQSLSQDMSQWTMTFHGGVETIVGPVVRWEERLHADSPSGLGPRGMLLTSREMSITQMGLSPEGNPLLELAATGRPQIESQSFRANGDRLSYDGSKGLLVLEGGREDARFWRRTETGAETHGAAQRIQYWPRDNHLEADLRSLDLTGLRNALTPANRPK